MTRFTLDRWARRAVWGTLVAVVFVGCNPLQLAAFMFAREDKRPAPYPLTFAKDGPKKDKDEVVVLLLTHQTASAGTNFVTADRELADRLARVLPEMAKENKDKRKVRVISSTQLDKFKMANPKWRDLSPGEIGQKLGADFVLDIFLEKMRLYQQNSANTIYEGRAEVTVAIHEVTASGSEVKDDYKSTFSYPRGGVSTRDASSVSEGEFKKLFLDNMATELARMHCDHKPSSGIAEGR
jgi:hypothetical protein